MTVGAVSFLAGLTVAIFIYAIFMPAEKPRASRTANSNIFQDTEERSEELNSFDKYVRPALKNFLPQSPMVHNLKGESRDRIETLLLQSGNPFKLSPEEFVGLQFLAAFFGVALGAVLGIFSPVPYLNVYDAVPLFGVLMYLVPYVIHTSRRDKKATRIQKELPEALDLLVVTINAGNGFTTALGSVARRLPEGNTMRDEFRRVHAEIQSGTTTTKALKELSYRTASDDVAAFVGSILQSEKTGADPTETLQAQAALARQSYEARLEQKSAQLSTLMFVPLILTMLPALIIIFVAPAVLQLGSVF